MSTFRWACQKKFSEGLQNLGFISVARQSFRVISPIAERELENLLEKVNKTHLDFTKGRYFKKQFLADD